MYMQGIYARTCVPGYQVCSPTNNAAAAASAHCRMAKQLTSFTLIDCRATLPKVLRTCSMQYEAMRRAAVAKFDEIQNSVVLEPCNFVGVGGHQTSSSSSSQPAGQPSIRTAACCTHTAAVKKWSKQGGPDVSQ